ncbi:hypothetical protein ABH977_004026 [Bradyrhizobium ottawaense]|uniref:hypothetical protein n=1 Tax=Bradyrhizobium ottawaense TaxID=931866 RepID=UPI003514F8C9
MNILVGLPESRAPALQNHHGGAEPYQAADEKERQPQQDEAQELQVGVADAIKLDDLRRQRQDRRKDQAEDDEPFEIAEQPKDLVSAHLAPLMISPSSGPPANAVSISGPYHTGVQVMHRPCRL